MNIIVSITLMVLLGTLLVYDLKKRNSIFSPVCYFCLFFFVTRVIRLLVPESQASYIFRVNDENYLLYLVYSCLYIAVVCATMDYFTKKKDTLNYENGEPYNKGFILAFLGIMAQVTIINMIGGLDYIWSNIASTSILLGGYGYLSWLFVLSTYGIGLLLVCYMENGNAKTKYSFWFMLLLVCFFSMAFGKRAPLFRIVVSIVPIVYFYKKDTFLKFFSFKNIIIMFSLLFILISFPMMRTADFRLSHGFIDSVLKSNNHLVMIICNLSPGVDADLFTYYFFSEHDKWLGKSYIDLLYAWIPSSLLTDKPPVDDGMYLDNLMLGFYVEPSLSVSAFPHRSSVPFTNSGIGFANFGTLGVIAFAFAHGLIVSKQYNKIYNSNHCYIDIIFYSILSTTFALSVKGIVELLMSYLIYRIVKRFINTKIKIRL